MRFDTRITDRFEARRAETVEDIDEGGAGDDGAGGGETEATERPQPGAEMRIVKKLETQLAAQNAELRTLKQQQQRESRQREEAERQRETRIRALLGEEAPGQADLVKAPDPLEDPEGYAKHVAGQAQEGARNVVRQHEDRLTAQQQAARETRRRELDASVSSAFLGKRNYTAEQVGQLQDFITSNAARVCDFDTGALTLEGLEYAEWKLFGAQTVAEAEARGASRSQRNMAEHLRTGAEGAASRGGGGRPRDWADMDTTEASAALSEMAATLTPERLRAEVGKIPQEVRHAIARYRDGRAV